MKIHVIRSTEVSYDRFDTICEIINKVKGPVQFVIDKNIKAEQKIDDSDDFDYRLAVLPWKTIFGLCDIYRKENGVKDEDIVVLLTDYRNSKRWFSAWDESGKKNYFIQTSNWDFFVDSDSCYPVVYELASVPLYFSLCETPDDLLKLAHRDPKGCPFDFCGDKKDVILKLRTGDICQECREIMIQNNFDPAVARQIFSIFDNIRSQMLFKERFSVTQQLSKIEVNLPKRELKFISIGGITVKLNPMEISVYQLFISLSPDQGIAFNYMVDYRDKIRELYKRHATTAEIALIESRVNAIVENSDDTLSQLISRINKKIKDIVGEGIARNYQIIGERAEPRKILLNRELVQFVELPNRI